MEPGIHEIVHLDASNVAPAQARRALRQAVAACLDPDLAHTAELLVSELVTNAVTHGSGPVVLSIDCAGRVVSVAVRDSQPAHPEVQPERLMALGGRGLRMVEALAGAWGVRSIPSGPGKEVWFRLP